ncbi:hypothetical protein SKAU_G00142070 [Synaphobranchus kaupii]|uniref:Zinc-binding protein A33-like n=1 Tax=Synaphobranchus kaupii TaxID=118154 RepID=A0A9Q1J435_SYNKA|nr:hypothetical protein SKAU_G00142070 [Synaphobranchus kaupii]
MQVKAEFEKLHQFLREEEEGRLAALREEEERKSQIMKEKLEQITRHVSTLSDKITAVEKAMDNEDTSFLKNYKNIKERAQCTLQDPELLSGALIDVAKHLGNLKYRVWEKMLEMVQYTPVLLDPNTARAYLSLSDDLTTVTHTGIKQKCPDNPERFNRSVNVLGSEGFTSGKHSWEVKVGNKTQWTIGVVKESISTKGKITYSPEGGFWVMKLRNGDDYCASGGPNLTLERKPQNIRVQLDYDVGEVSFFDTSDMSHIYTFTDTFTERVFPYFSPCLKKDGNDAPLQICPVKQYWEKKSSRECPICRSKASVEDPPVNLVLRSIVESFLKQKTESEIADRSDARCSLHGEKLLFFCEHDKEPLCVVCQTSKKHRNHPVCPVEEASLDLKEEIKPALNRIKEKLKRFSEVEQECKKTAEHIKSQAQHTERQVKAEFEKLHQFLREEEEARLAVLKEDEKLKSQIMKEKIENITRHFSTLTHKLAVIEKAMEAEDISFLKSYRNIKERAQCTLQDPELLSGALIDVAKHLGNLKYRVWEKMLGVVQYTPVTLDPNIASPWLSLSNDLTSVRDTGVYQQLPDNPERFDSCVDVLGSEGFNSGKHSWEVEVGSQPAWEIGVVNESNNRKGRIAASPMRGFWVLALTNGDEYEACASSGVSKNLRLERKPQRIRVQLDYDRGEVSFLDPSDMFSICTLKCKFTERIFPYFCLYPDGKPGAMRICPVKVSVTLMT